jgi:hypothetical protein
MSAIKSMLVSAGLSGLVFAFFPEAPLWSYFVLGALVGTILPHFFEGKHG